MITRINVPMSYLFTYIILVQIISYPKLLEERELWRTGPGRKNCLFCLWPFAEDNFLLFCFLSNLQSYDYTVIPRRELYKATVLWDAQGHYLVQKKGKYVLFDWEESSFFVQKHKIEVHSTGKRGSTDLQRPTLLFCKWSLSKAVSSPSL